MPGQGTAADPSTALHNLVQRLEQHPVFRSDVADWEAFLGVLQSVRPIADSLLSSPFALSSSFVKTAIKLLERTEEGTRRLSSVLADGGFHGFLTHPSRYVAVIMDVLSDFRALFQLLEVTRVPNVSVPLVHRLLHPEALRFWLKNFGGGAVDIPSGLFFSAFSHEFGRMSEDPYIRSLRTVLDPGNSSSVSIVDFAVFSFSSGPRDRCARLFELDRIVVPTALFDPRTVREVHYSNGCYLHGEVQDGHIHGRAVFTYPDGRKYIGGYRDGVRHGIGFFYREKNGIIVEQYAGEWKNGVRSGLGVLTVTCPEDSKALEPEKAHPATFFSTKDCLWQEDRIQGRGRFVQNTGDVYEGEVIPGKARNTFWMHGRGKYKWVDGRVYEGQWRYSRPHGRGTMIWPDGRQYDGEWKEGKICGSGEMRFPGGRIHRGSFSDNRAHGRMVSIWPDGVEFDGQYRMGFRNGSGLYRFPDGRCIRGEFFEEPAGEDKGGVRMGRCRILMDNGSSYDGPYTRMVQPRTFTLADGRMLVPPENGGGSGGPSSLGSPRVPDSISGHVFSMRLSSLSPFSSTSTHTESEPDPKENPAVVPPVKQWLQTCSLEEYWDRFCSMGYDHMDIVASLTEEEIRDQLGIRKPGHVKKFIREIQKLQCR